MKRSIYKALALLVCLMMLVSGIAGCKTATPPTAAPAETKAPDATEAPAAATEPATKLDTSKQVELQFYMVGDGPKDLELITDKVNETTLADFNCTVKFNYTTWTDFAQKYSLLLSSGTPIDLIYTATWLDYWKYAKAGAFKPLNELLDNYAPELKAFIGDDYLSQAAIDGKIFTVPSNYKEFITDGVTYRKDLQEKFSLPVPDSLENVEKYLLGVKQNMPEQQLTMESVTTGVGVYTFSAMEILMLKYADTFGDYGLQFSDTDPANIHAYWGTDAFREDMKMFKRWADQGFWSKSVLSQQLDSAAFDNGNAVIVMQGENPMKYSGHLLTFQTDSADYEVGYYSYAFANKVALSVHPCQNGYAIPISSQNPERAIAFYQKLVMDKALNQLTEYGIEGTHYNNNNGYYEAIGDAAETGFAREGMNGWAWRNEGYMLYDKSFDVVKELNTQLEPYRKTNYAGGFAEDFTSYQSQRAALGTVMTQYLAPLEAGLVDDVDAAVDEFMEKANAAGLQEIWAEYTKQWQAYVSNIGLK